jgi:hypothetical protein
LPVVPPGVPMVSIPSRNPAGCVSKIAYVPAGKLENT